MRRLLIATFCLAHATVGSAAPLDPPPPAAVAEARQIVAQMIADRRGPYSAIRWFCNDGVDLPPAPYACKTHGGGRQHAVYSPERERLAQLGWSVGTIFAATDFATLFDSEPRQQRLRELALERYLRDVDDGWVMRRARDYRGHVQVEGEADAGRALLRELLSRSDWARENFLLVREMARVIPHGEDDDLARSVRRDAIALAELEPRAQAWRYEIHTAPGPDIAARMRAWLAQESRPEVKALGGRLADDLDALYGPAGRRARLEASLVGLPKVAREWSAEVRSALAPRGEAGMAALCATSATARAELFPALAPRDRLTLIDAMQNVESEALLTFQDIDVEQATRRSLVRTSRALIDCGYGSGLLSPGERAALIDALALTAAGADDDDADDADDSVALAEYQSAITRLKRAPVWALGSIRHTFAEPLIRYTALDPRAARFSDDLLRESPMRALGGVIKALSRDSDRLSGSVVDIAGQPVATALALNSGVATGRLRIFQTLDDLEHARLARTDVVVLPETIAELSPVAGILTLGEGNALSHVQLLARNFGIPNVAIDQETTDLLAPLEGQEVILVVDARGNVVLRPMDDGIRTLLGGNRAPTDVRVTVPEPDLSQLAPLPLDAVGRELSGRLVGPKAANLGELARLFPGRVAPAVAIPFGIYARHLEDAGLMPRITSAFARRAGGELEQADFDAEIAAVRAEVQALRLSPDTRAALTALMGEQFGAPGTYGVFVRSDTNVEDLPQFTGAGLNETLPNVVGLDAQLAGVTRVWASVLSPRAIAWRADILADPARIYASVLLMKSVASTKSGVMVTANLVERSAPGLTVSVAWGVGGAVAGESAESLVLRPDGVELVSEGKAPWQRGLADAGGMAWAPAPNGPVLTPMEIEALRRLAVEATERYVPALDAAGQARPWDIEFGFVDGELTLFQIRPLVERASARADAILGALQTAPTALPDPATRVSMSTTPGGPAS
ncbi:MAG TPA: PEP/pyruvate-binding domain-containing protein [Pseudomonadales bacterium]|nr:PEP/pyruvate-binding domain-containing protein [Pseudomonadales bacterium]